VKWHPFNGYDMPTAVRWRQDVPTVGYNPHQVRRIMKVNGVSWAYCRLCGGWNPTETLLTASHGRG